MASYFDRYAVTPDVEYLFSPEFKQKSFIKIQAAWLDVLSEYIPIIDIENINFLHHLVLDPCQVKEYEKTTKHDVVAMIKACVDNLKFHGHNDIARWIHICLTSQDINDTTTGLMFFEIDKIIHKKTRPILDVLRNLALCYQDTLCVSRTHGQVAVPMAFGQRFAIWFDDLMHAEDDFYELRYGKLAGAVGTYSSLRQLLIASQSNLSFLNNKLTNDNKSNLDFACEFIEHKVLESLDLEQSFSKTQILSRQYISKFIYGLVVIASVCGRIAHQIRHLQRQEINELSEFFDTDTQVGSSAMPQKRNPYKSEQICGLVKTLQPMILTCLQNIDNDDERDLTNSSSERVVIENVVKLTTYILDQMYLILQNLQINDKNIKKNYETYASVMKSEHKLNELVINGKDRQDAYHTVKNSLENKLDMSSSNDNNNDEFLYVITEVKTSLSLKRYD